MTQAERVSFLNVEDYLEGEQHGDVRHEYSSGSVFAMAGASDAHNRIAGNIFATLLSAARGTPCRVYISDMKVRADLELFYYPDVMVTCDPEDTENYFKQFPCLLVEVLSPSTSHIDKGEKLYNYCRLASLETYVLVSQDLRRLEVYRRLEDGGWRYDVLEGEDALELSCPPLELTLEDVYRDVL